MMLVWMFLRAWWKPLVVLLAAVVLVTTIYQAGARAERAKWQARAAAAEASARVTERTATSLAAAAERASIDSGRRQLEHAHAELERLRAQLKNQPRCPVSVAAVRLLDGVDAGVPATTRTAALAGAAAPRMASDAGAASLAAAAQPDQRAIDTLDAAEVIENCAWNRLHVAEPNAQQLGELQAFYARLRTLLNHP